jgi:NuA3 HAT complex component NTO1
MQDLSTVFSRGIEEGPSGKLETQLTPEKEHLSPSKHVAYDIKERRRLAKRITKMIQPLLEVAVRAEADVTRKSADKMIHELEGLLEACLQARQQSLPGPALETEADHDAMQVDNSANGGNEKKRGRGLNGVDQVEGARLSGSMDDDLHDEDAPGEEVDDAEMFPAISDGGDADSGVLMNPADFEAEDATSQIKSQYRGNGLKPSDTPPDINGYHPTLEHHQPQPPTPPVSNGGPNSTNGLESAGADSAASLTDGGIPWYLKSFDPIGTTIGELQWTGRDVVRSMSEELSEIDDDELTGMGAEMEGIQGEAEEVVEVNKIEAVARTKTGRMKRRWRGFK